MLWLTFLVPRTCSMFPTCKSTEVLQMPLAGNDRGLATRVLRVPTKGCAFRCDWTSNCLVGQGLK
eukprot:4778001-Amphidinium_carterae.1